jgi:hypothetical protein
MNFWLLDFAICGYPPKDQDVTLLDRPTELQRNYRLTLRPTDDGLSLRQAVGREVVQDFQER